MAFTSLLELWKSQDFTPWRSLSSNIPWYHEQWRCPHLTDCWSPGLVATQDQMPNSWWDSGECTAPFAEAILVSAVSDCSLSQHFSKLRQRHGAGWWAAKEGSALGGETNFLCMVQGENMALKQFQDLRSMISCLILLGAWCCSDGLVYKTRSFVKACQKSVTMP